MGFVTMVTYYVTVVAVALLTNCEAMGTTRSLPDSCSGEFREGDPVVYTEEEQHEFLSMHTEGRNNVKLFPTLYLRPMEMAYFYTLGYQTDRLLEDDDYSRRRKRDAEELEGHTEEPHTEEPHTEEPEDYTERGRGEPERPLTRWEVRQLTEIEWTALTRVFNYMKNKPIFGKGGLMTEYDIFTHHYNYKNSPGARRGPTTLPWHREFLKRFEEAVKSHGLRDGFGLPYWDSALDEPLPNPADSVVWSEIFFGNSIGPVWDGPFKDWMVTYGCQNLLNSDILRRDIHPGNARYLFNLQKISQNLLNKTNYSQISYPHGPEFENDFEAVLYYVGGHMGQSACATNDPVFWFHHSYVDLLWEEFRHNSQQTNPSTDYPPNSSQPPYEHLKPFEPMLNLHAMDKHYSLYYKYSKRPSALTCTEDSHCRSKYLWCDTDRGCRCVSKVKEHGVCWGLPDTACYCSTGDTPRCFAGLCTCKRNVVRIVRKK